MDLFELQAVLRLNAEQYTEGIDDAEKKGTGFLDGLANTWTKTKAKFQTAKSILSPVIDIVTQAVESYSTYEQAVGGVQKLFGTATDTITKNARKAFQTAGMSINEYMDMCIQSGATMLKSVGEDSAKAAEMMDLAILDMSDNVNALGTDMTAVQNAYRGFSRGNFTMLDNLALGFAGTKEGMEELLATASELDKTTYSIESFSDIVQAIHTIQQSRNIAGTTAAEGRTTIQGSRAYMEAAKENMLVVQADTTSSPEEKEEAAKAYAEAIGQYLDNIIPIITGVLKSLLKAVVKIIPELIKEVPDLVTALVDVITSILKDHTLIGQLVQVFAYAIVTGIAGLIDVLLTALIRLFNGDFASGSSAFAAWGVYDWIDDVFGFKDENGNTVDVGNKRYTGGIRVGAENFVPEGMYDKEVYGEKVALAQAETLEGAEKLLTLAFGKKGAGVGQDKEQGITKVSANGYSDQTFANTADAIYYIYKLLEHEGMDIEELKAMRDAGAKYEAEKVDVWERNGEQIELPPGMNATAAKNLLNAVLHAGADSFTAEDLSNENVKQLLDMLATGLSPEQLANLNAAEMTITSGEVASINTGEVQFNNGLVTVNVFGAVQQGLATAEAEANAEPHAKGLWNVPYDDYLANLHRGEMVLTASQAREFRNGSGGGGADIVAAINGMRNDLQNLQLVVGQKAFGTAVVDYSGRRMQGYIGQAEDRLISGYGWG